MKIKHWILSILFTLLTLYVFFEGGLKPSLLDMESFPTKDLRTYLETEDFAIFVYGKDPLTIIEVSQNTFTKKYKIEDQFTIHIDKKFLGLFSTPSQRIHYQITQVDNQKIINYDSYNNSLRYLLLLSIPFFFQTQISFLFNQFVSSRRKNHGES